MDDKIYTGTMPNCPTCHKPRAYVGDVPEGGFPAGEEPWCTCEQIFNRVDFGEKEAFEKLEKENKELRDQIGKNRLAWKHKVDDLNVEIKELKRVIFDYDNGHDVDAKENKELREGWHSEIVPMCRYRRDCGEICDVCDANGRHCLHRDADMNNAVCEAILCPIIREALNGVPR